MSPSHNARVPSTPFPATMEDSDEALMLRYAAGDLGAFDVLYGRHELAVWRFVFRSVKVQAVADDLLQDVWFAVARNAARYEVKAKFRTWLFTLAHHRLVDHWRTHKQHASLDAETEDGAALAETLAAECQAAGLRNPAVILVELPKEARALSPDLVQAGACA